MIKRALLDIVGGLAKYPFWLCTAWQEITIRYRRSVLGPFWITASTAIYVISISFVFSMLFNQNVKQYILYMSIGVVVWNYINQTIIEGSESFIASAGLIKNVALEKSVFIFQTVTRNIYFFLHNLVVLAVCAVLLDANLTLYSVGKALFGFAILSVNLFFLSLALACICSRFMDLRQIILSILQIAFLVTPIMWIPTQSMQSKAFILELNPFYNFIDFIRYSLLPSGFPPMPIHPDIKYLFMISLINIVISLLVFAKAKKSIAYWV